MNALVMNCSPVRNGATAEIVTVFADRLKERYDVRSICIDDFDGHLEFECCGRLGLCSVENKEAVKQREPELIAFCHTI